MPDGERFNVPVPTLATATAMLQRMNQKRQRSLQGLVEEGRAVSDYPPEPFVPVLAHFEEFSCMAYLDEKGIWRSRFDNTPIAARIVAWEAV